MSDDLRARRFLFVSHILVFLQGVWTQRHRDLIRCIWLHFLTFITLQRHFLAMSQTCLYSSQRIPHQLSHQCLVLVFLGHCGTVCNSTHIHLHCLTLPDWCFLWLFQLSFSFFPPKTLQRAGKREKTVT